MYINIILESPWTWISYYFMSSTTWNKMASMLDVFNPFAVGKKLKNTLKLPQIYLCNLTPTIFFVIVQNQHHKIDHFHLYNPLKLTCSWSPALLIHNKYTNQFQQMRTEQQCENEFTLKPWVLLIVAPVFFMWS